MGFNMATTASRATVADDIAVVEAPERTNGHRRIRVPWRSERRRSTAPGRVAQLDLLRAFAILLVIGRHLELTRPDGPVGVFAEA